MKPASGKKRRAVKPKVEFSDTPLQIMKSILNQQLETVTEQEHGMTISVDDLPECEYKKFLTEIVQNPKTSKICVVAFSYPGGKSWDASIGYPDIRDLKAVEVTNQPWNQAQDILWKCENIRGHADVLLLGDKLPKEVACKLFPTWAGKAYRE
jgi:hypothetical protein